MVPISNYTFIGFDLRTRLTETIVPSVDIFVWDQAEIVYKEILGLGYKENVYQLLDCPLSVIEEVVERHPDIAAVAIGISPSGFRAMRGHYGEPLNIVLNCLEVLENRGWIFQGFDVADTNGYFSIYGIDDGDSKLLVGTHLFMSDADAEAVCRPADILYPSHAPFAVFSVFTFGNV